MKKLLLVLSLITTSAMADYRLIIPQNPGDGTSVWASVVAREWEKKLGEKIVLEHIPGANDIPGFNKFHNELRKDPKVIMVAHGGNAESYLIHKVDYNYANYTPIGLQNLTIMVGHRKEVDPYSAGVKFAAGSGMNPDAMAMTMLMCGPNKSMTEYADCYKQKMKYVPGMKGSERRLAYIRGELTATRETTAAYNKYYKTMADNTDWFSHGTMDIKTGKVALDPNFPGLTFQEVFKKKWGVQPSGEFYNAYLLVKQYRDTLQKSLWVDKTNPNAQVLRKSLNEMLADPASVAAIEKETGKYEWIVGDDVNKATKQLENITTKQALKNLVWWSTIVFGQEAFYKDNIAAKAK